MAQDAGCTGDAVKERIFTRRAQLLAGLLLLVDDLGRGLDHLVYDGVLAAAQGDLVGQLIEAAGRAGALAVCAAHRKALAGRPAHQTRRRARLGQNRQMQHDRHAQAGAQVGRAGGQIAQLVAVVEGNAVLNELCQPSCGLHALLGAQAGAHDLQADVVLLAEHDGDVAAVRGDEVAAALGKFRGDHVALDELHGLLAAGAHLGHVQAVRHGRGGRDGVPDLLGDLILLAGRQVPVRIAFYIARETHAGRSGKAGKAAVNCKVTHCSVPPVDGSRRAGARLPHSFPA